MVFCHHWIVNLLSKLVQIDSFVTTKKITDYYPVTSKIDVKKNNYLILHLFEETRNSI